MKANKTKPNTNHNANRRILAKGCYISNNTWATGLNNNDIIIGPSGSGKTRGYVKPNILQCNESMIIADTKGNLIKELKKPLEKAGYKVIDMNFKNLAHSYGYNPFDYIRYDKESGRYNEQDILTIASAIVPKPASKNDPFWELAAKMYFTSAVAYTMECLPEDEHNLDSAITLSLQMGNGNYAKLIEELECVNPDSLNKLISTEIKIDCTDEMRERNVITEKETKTFSGKFLDIIPSDKKQGHYYFKLRTSIRKIMPLYGYGETTTQIIRFPSYLLYMNKTVSDTKENITIKRFLIQRFEIIRNDKNNFKIKNSIKKIKCNISIDKTGGESICSYCGVNISSNDYQSVAAWKNKYRTVQKNVEKILSYYKKTGYIDYYSADNTGSVVGSIYNPFEL